MISLYPDQEEFISDIRNLWRDHKRIVGLAATGFGKTRVAARILEGFAGRGLKTCFIVPRVSLMEQTAKALIELGLDDLTYLWADHDYRPGAMITIASADTYIRRDKNDYALTIVDECHLRRKQLLEWMTAHPDDRYLGLSGTPYAPWIGTYYTALAKAKPMRWLIDNGRLSEYEVYAPSTPDTSKLKTKAGAYGHDFQEDDLAELMGKPKIVGDIVKNRLEHGENRLTMALCVNVKHANQVCIEFNKMGVTAEVITAKTPVEERERTFARMRAGITRVVTSVNALTEGLDIKEIGCVINARPTRSEARYIQGMGRGLRVAPGKPNCKIFDHSGTTLELGMPEDISIDYLSAGDDGMGKTQKRIDDDKPEKLPKVCTQCSFLKPAGMYVCAKCGFKPLLGANVSADTSRGLEKIKGKKAKITMDDKQKFYSELLGYQREREAEGRPIKDGWVSNQYKNKFGVWPQGLERVVRPVSVTTRQYIRSQFVKFAKQKEKAANENNGISGGPVAGDIRALQSAAG